MMRARSQVNNGQYNAGSIPSTAPSAVSGNVDDSNWRPAVVSTSGAPSGKYDWAVIIGLVLLVIVFERNS
jgi:hypothetical protein